MGGGEDSSTPELVAIRQIFVSVELQSNSHNRISYISQTTEMKMYTNEKPK